MKKTVPLLDRLWWGPFTTSAGKPPFPTSLFILILGFYTVVALILLALFLVIPSPGIRLENSVSRLEVNQCFVHLRSCDTFFSPPFATAVKTSETEDGIRVLSLDGSWIPSCAVELCILPTRLAAESLQVALSQSVLRFTDPSPSYDLSVSSYDAAKVFIGPSTSGGDILLNLTTGLAHLYNVRSPLVDAVVRHGPVIISQPFVPISPQMNTQSLIVSGITRNHAYCISSKMNTITPSACVGREGNYSEAWWLNIPVPSECPIYTSFIGTSGTTTTVHVDASSLYINDLLNYTSKLLDPDIDYPSLLAEIGRVSKLVPSRVAGSGIEAVPPMVAPAVIDALAGTDHWLAGESFASYVQTVDIMTPTFGSAYKVSNKAKFLEIGPEYLTFFTLFALQPTYRRMTTALSHYRCPSSQALEFMAAQTLMAPIASMTTSDQSLSNEVVTRLFLNQFPLVDQAIQAEYIRNATAGPPLSAEAISATGGAAVRAAPTVAFSSVTTEIADIVEANAEHSGLAGGTPVRWSVWTISRGVNNTVTATKVTLSVISTCLLVFSNLASLLVCIAVIMTVIYFYDPIICFILSVDMRQRYRAAASYKERVPYHVGFGNLNVFAWCIFKVFAVAFAAIGRRQRVARFCANSLVVRSDAEADINTRARAGKPNEEDAAMTNALNAIRGTSAATLTSRFQRWCLLKMEDPSEIPREEFEEQLRLFGAKKGSAPKLFARGVIRKVEMEPEAVAFTGSDYDSLLQFVDITGQLSRDSVDLDILRMLCFPEFPEKVASLTNEELAKTLKSWRIDVQEKSVSVFTGVAPKSLTHEVLLTPYFLREVVHSLESSFGLVPSYGAVQSGMTGSPFLRFFITFAEAGVIAVVVIGGFFFAYFIGALLDFEHAKYSVSTTVMTPALSREALTDYDSHAKPRNPFLAISSYIMTFYVFIAVIEPLVVLATVPFARAYDPRRRKATDLLLLLRLILSIIALAGALMAFLFLLWYLTTVVMWWILGAIIAPERMLVFAASILATIGVIGTTISNLDTTRKAAQKRIEKRVLEELVDLVRSASSKIMPADQSSLPSSSSIPTAPPTPINVGLMADCANPDPSVCEPARDKLCVALGAPKPILKLMLAVARPIPENITAAVCDTLTALGAAAPTHGVATQLVLGLLGYPMKISDLVHPLYDFVPQYKPDLKANDELVVSLAKAALSESSGTEKNFKMVEVFIAITCGFLHKTLAIPQVVLHQLVAAIVALLKNGNTSLALANITAVMEQYTVQLPETPSMLRPVFRLLIEGFKMSLNEAHSFREATCELIASTPLRRTVVGELIIPALGSEINEHREDLHPAMKATIGLMKLTTATSTLQPKHKATLTVLKTLLSGKARAIATLPGALNAACGKTEKDVPLPWGLPSGRTDVKQLMNWSLNIAEGIISVWPKLILVQDTIEAANINEKLPSPPPADVHQLIKSAERYPCSDEFFKTEYPNLDTDQLKLCCDATAEIVKKTRDFFFNEAVTKTPQDPAVAIALWFADQWMLLGAIIGLRCGRPLPPALCNYDALESAIDVPVAGLEMFRHVGQGALDAIHFALSHAIDVPTIRTAFFKAIEVNQAKIIKSDTIEIINPATNEPIPNVQQFFDVVSEVLGAICIDALPEGFLPLSPASLLEFIPTLRNQLLSSNTVAAGGLIDAGDNLKNQVSQKIRSKSFLTTCGLPEQFIEMIDEPFADKFNSLGEQIKELNEEELEEFEKQRAKAKEEINTTFHNKLADNFMKISDAERAIPSYIGIDAYVLNEITDELVRSGLASIVSSVIGTAGGLIPSGGNSASIGRTLAKLFIKNDIIKCLEEINPSQQAQEALLMDIVEWLAAKGSQGKIASKVLPDPATVQPRDLSAIADFFDVPKSVIRCFESPPRIAMKEKALNIVEFPIRALYANGTPKSLLERCKTQLRMFLKGAGVLEIGFKKIEQDLDYYCVLGALRPELTEEEMDGWTMGMLKKYNAQLAITNKWKDAFLGTLKIRSESNDVALISSAVALHRVNEAKRIALARKEASQTVASAVAIGAFENLRGEQKTTETLAMKWKLGAKKRNALEGLDNTEARLQKIKISAARPFDEADSETVIEACFHGDALFTLWRYYFSILRTKPSIVNPKKGTSVEAAQVFAKTWTHSYLMPLLKAATPKLHARLLSIVENFKKGPQKLDRRLTPELHCLKVLLRALGLHPIVASYSPRMHWTPPLSSALLDQGREPTPGAVAVVEGESDAAASPPTPTTKPKPGTPLPAPTNIEFLGEGMTAEEWLNLYGDSGYEGVDFEGEVPTMNAQVQLAFTLASPFPLLIPEALLENVDGNPKGLFGLLYGIANWVTSDIAPSQTVAALFAALVRGPDAPQHILESITSVAPPAVRRVATDLATIAKYSHSHFPFPEDVSLTSLGSYFKIPGQKMREICAVFFPSDEVPDDPRELLTLDEETKNFVIDSVPNWLGFVKAVSQKEWLTLIRYAAILPGPLITAIGLTMQQPRLRRTLASVFPSNANLQKIAFNPTPVTLTALFDLQSAAEAIAGPQKFAQYADAFPGLVAIVEQHSDMVKKTMNLVIGALALLKGDFDSGLGALEEFASENILELAVTRLSVLAIRLLVRGGAVGDHDGVLRAVITCIHAIPCLDDKIHSILKESVAKRGVPAKYNATVAAKCKKYGFKDPELILFLSHTGWFLATHMYLLLDDPSVPVLPAGIVSPLGFKSSRVIDGQAFGGFDAKIRGKQALPSTIGNLDDAAALEVDAAAKAIQNEAEEGVEGAEESVEQLDDDSDNESIPELGNDPIIASFMKMIEAIESGDFKNFPRDEEMALDFLGLGETAAANRDDDAQDILSNFLQKLKTDQKLRTTAIDTLCRIIPKLIPSEAQKATKYLRGKEAVMKEALDVVKCVSTAAGKFLSYKFSISLPEVITELKKIYIQVDEAVTAHEVSVQKLDEKAGAAYTAEKAAERKRIIEVIAQFELVMKRISAEQGPQLFIDLLSVAAESIAGLQAGAASSSNTQLAAAKGVEAKSGGMALAAVVGGVPQVSEEDMRLVLLILQLAKGDLQNAIPALFSEFGFSTDKKKIEKFMGVLTAVTAFLNGKGLSTSDALGAIGGGGPKQLLQQVAQLIFNELDLDGSGELSFSEFKIALERLRVAVPEHEALVVFQTLDTDGSGVLTVEEFMVALDTIRDLYVARMLADMHLSQEAIYVAIATTILIILCLAAFLLLGFLGFTDGGAFTASTTAIMPLLAGASQGMKDAGSKMKLLFDKIDAAVGKMFDMLKETEPMAADVDD